MIGILDYGVGNLKSVERAFRHVGAEVRVQADVLGIDKLVLPGVGAFHAAIERLGARAKEVIAFARTGNPVLGICLGHQLLFEVSDEMGETRGLGLIPGRVSYLPRVRGLKIPHIGWNDVSFDDGLPMAQGVAPNSQFYFVHSLAAQCAEPEDVVGLCEYGLPFVAAVRRGNIWGTQFHPEKSGEAGLKLLMNFATC